MPCDPKLAIFVILGAMNWVPKWFKPSGAWKPEQLTLALEPDIRARSVLVAGRRAWPRDVGDLPVARASRQADVAGPTGQDSRAGAAKAPTKK